MRLDGSLEDTWRGLAFESDVIILSKSTFSNVPAILRAALDAADDDHPRARVVYTSWIHHPLPGWDEVEKELLTRAKAKALEMFAKCPKNETVK